MILIINKLCGPPTEISGVSIKQLYNLLIINIINCLLGLVDSYSVLIFKGKGSNSPHLTLTN
jgi:hypothetical protein